MPKKHIQILLFTLFLTACGREMPPAYIQLDDKGPEEAPLEEAAKPEALASFSVDEQGLSRVDAAAWQSELDAYGGGALAEEELPSLRYILEQEKMKRDLAARAFLRWDNDLFDEVSAAEHSHVSAIRALATSRQADISSYKNDLGVFANQNIAGVYKSLEASLRASEMEALAALAEAEENSIADLKRYLEKIDNRQLKQTYEMLAKASRNHLRLLVTEIMRGEGAYETKVLSKEEFGRVMGEGVEF